MKNWKELKKELLKEKKVSAEYQKLSSRYQVISRLIEIRIKKGLTQEALAKKIGTKQTAIARVESGNANPTLEFLEKMTSAMNAKLCIHFK